MQEMDPPIMPSNGKSLKVGTPILQSMNQYALYDIECLGVTQQIFLTKLDCESNHKR
jgi:hypothetical protein